jgi:hypothetical protein
MTDPAAALGKATSALYAAVLQLESAAEQAYAEANALGAAAAAARAAYEDATIHTDEPRCNATMTRHGTHGPCARPAGHAEAYHRNASGTQLWLSNSAEPTAT